MGYITCIIICPTLIPLFDVVRVAEWDILNQQREPKCFIAESNNLQNISPFNSKEFFLALRRYSDR